MSKSQFVSPVRPAARSGGTRIRKRTPGDNARRRTVCVSFNDAGRWRLARRAREFGFRSISALMESALAEYVVKHDLANTGA